MFIFNNYFILHFLGFDHHKELFHSSRDSSDLFQCYTTYITKQLSQFSEEFEATHIGAVIIEPGKKGQLYIVKMFCNNSKKIFIYLPF